MLDVHKRTDVVLDTENGLPVHPLGVGLMNHSKVSFPPSPPHGPTPFPGGWEGGTAKLCRSYGLQSRFCNGGRGNSTCKGWEVSEAWAMCGPPTYLASMTKQFLCFTVFCYMISLFLLKCSCVPEPVFSPLVISQTLALVELIYFLHFDCCLCPSDTHTRFPNSSSSVASYHITHVYQKTYFSFL